MHWPKEFETSMSNPITRESIFLETDLKKRIKKNGAIELHRFFIKNNNTDYSLMTFTTVVLPDLAVTLTK